MIGKILSLALVLVLIPISSAIAQEASGTTPTISPSIMPFSPRYKETVVLEVTSTNTRKEIGHGRQIFIENVGNSRCYFAIGNHEVVATVPVSGDPGIKGDMPAPVGRPILVTAYVSNNSTTRKYIAAICPAGETTSLEVLTGAGQ